jgi:hypothetical protein
MQHNRGLIMNPDMGITRVNDQNLEELLRAEQVVLVLSRRDCTPCRTFQEDLDALLDQGQLEGIAVGKMVLNEPGSSRFKRAHPWLVGQRVLPYVILYHHGREQRRFVPASGSHLLRQIEETFGHK